MARQNIMVDPSRRVFEAYLDFSGGRNSEISNEELKDNEFPTLDNVDLWSRGSCKRRTGRVSLGTVTGNPQGMFPFFRSNVTHPDLIIAAGGQLYVQQRSAGGAGIPDAKMTYTITQIPITDGGNAWTFQTTQSVQGVMYKGIMYIATGTKLVQVTWDATNGWKSQTVTPYQPTVMEVTYIGTNALAANPNAWIADGTGTSLTVAGVYIGMTTGSSVGNMAISGAVNVPFKFTCYINKPSSVTSVDYKWEYQLSTDGSTWTLGRDWTKDDGSGNAKNWTFTPQSIATYNFRVSVRDDANQSTTVTTFIQSSWVVNPTMNNQQNTPLPTGGIQSCTNAIVFYDRLILSGDNQNPYQLYISDLTNPAYFPTDNTISFDTGKLEPITSVIQFRDFLIIFTASTIQTLTGHTPASYARTLIQDGIGCIATRSAVVTGNTVTFLSSQGVMQLKPNPFLLQILNVNRVDMQIRTEILNAIQSGGTNACAFLYNSQYWICFPSTTQMFRLYYETGMIWTRDYSPKVVSTQFVVYGADRFELGSDNHVYIQDDSRFDDDGYAYTLVAEAKFFDLGSSFNWKKLKRIFLLAKHSTSDTNINLYIQADSNLVLTPDSGTATVVNKTDSYYGDVVWTSTTEPNIHFYAGTVVGSWVLGDSPLGDTQISVQRASIRGKCHRVKVTITHSDPVSCELFGYGIEFREKRPI